MLGNGGAMLLFAAYRVLFCSVWDARIKRLRCNRATQAFCVLI